MRILITGGAGYIGSKLLGQLLDSMSYHDVVVVDNLFYNNYRSIVPFLSHPKFTFIKADVSDQSFQDQFNPCEYDVIIPLAALVGMPICEEHRVQALATNLGHIKWIIDKLNSSASNDYFVPHVIFPNTNSGYGSIGTECTEETPMKPISTYGVTKCRAEEYIRNNYKFHTIFRLATVFGISPRPRLDLIVNDWAFKMFTDQPIDIYEGHFQRNFVHIADVSNCFKWAINERYRVIQKVYNLGNDRCNMSKLELAKLICQTYNKDLNKLIRVKEDKKDPDQRNYQVSNRKLRNAGFIPKYDLQYGLMELKQMFEIMPFSGIDEYFNYQSAV